MFQGMFTLDNDLVYSRYVYKLHSKKSVILQKSCAAMDAKDFHVILQISH